MKIKPLKNYLLLEVVEDKDKTESGIILPETKDDKIGIKRGIIIASGETTKIPLKTVVLFSPYSAHEFENNLLVKENDLLAIIE